MANKLIALRYKFIQFLANPTQEKTQDAWAKENHVSPATLSDWKKEPEFKRILVKEIEKNLLDSASDIYEVIRARAKKGDLGFVNLYLKQLEILKADKSEVETKPDPHFEELMQSLWRKEKDDKNKRQKNPRSRKTTRAKKQVVKKISQP